MRTRNAIAMTLVVTVTAVVLSCAQQARPAAPDLILHNGRIITVDASDRVAQAVAVTGSTIVAVGSDAEVMKLADSHTRRVDLKGRAVTPGLLDAHSHFSISGADRLFDLDVGYPNVKGIRDIVDSVRVHAASLKADVFVQGHGWDEGKFSERRLISATDLDAAAPNNPVWLLNTTGHYGVANSTALRLAGITKDTRDPPNGTIDRNRDGTPTGVLKEAAMSLVTRLIPPYSRDQIEQGMRELSKAYNAEGMTGLKDPGISAEDFDSYRRVAAAGELPVRVFALFSGGRSIAGAESLIAARAATARPYESTGDDHVIAGGVKLFMDGSGGARTAWMYDDWNKGYTGTDSGNTGYPAANPDTMRTMIKLFHAAGMHVSSHAIGDRAIDWIVDSYAQALGERPTKGLRHGIIHANIPTDRAIDEMARMQRDFDSGYPEPSAEFHWWIGDTYAGNFGPLRSKRLNPLRTFQRKGMIWANGSDYNVTPFPARYAIWTAVARETMLGVHGTDPFGRDESVDVQTALKAVTIWAAHQMFLDKKIGSIEVGKYADLAVWDRDPYSVPTVDLKEMTCLMTVFNGKVVYEAPAGM
ncbi:MAG: amidohydrolase [Gemmatimonadetes bacterium]|nr:amidohydrolase [Gemmatimonadota bacterium]